MSQSGEFGQLENLRPQFPHLGNKSSGKSMVLELWYVADLPGDTDR